MSKEPEKHLNKPNKVLNHLLLICMMFGLVFFSVLQSTKAQPSIGISGQFDQATLHMVAGGMIDSDEFGIILTNLTQKKVNLSIKANSLEYILIEPAFTELSIDSYKMITIPIKVEVNELVQPGIYESMIEIEIIDDDKDANNSIQLFSTIEVVGWGHLVNINVYNPNNEPINATISLLDTSSNQIKSLIKTVDTVLSTRLPDGIYEVVVSFENIILSKQPFILEGANSKNRNFNQIDAIVDTYFIATIQVQENYSFLRSSKELEVTYSVVNVDPNNHFDVVLLIEDNHKELYKEVVYTIKDGYVGKIEDIVSIELKPEFQSTNLIASIQLVDQNESVVLSFKEINYQFTSDSSNMFFLVVFIGIVSLVLLIIVLFLLFKKKQSSLNPTLKEEIIHIEPIKDVKSKHIYNVAKQTSYKSIQAAINDAHPYDTLWIGPGIYQEILVIEKPCTLLGFKKDHLNQKVVVNLSKQTNKEAVSVTIKSHDVTIKGLTFESNQVDNLASCALKVSGDHILIEENSFIGYNTTQILVVFSNQQTEFLYDIKIINNQFIKAKGYAILLKGASVEVKDNHIKNCYRGIKIDPLSTSIKGSITNNVIEVSSIAITMVSDHLYKPYWQINQNQKIIKEN